MSSLFDPCHPGIKVHP
jgi:hypothetical protein